MPDTRIETDFKLRLTETEVQACMHVSGVFGLAN